jgi:menaquinone-dependent protoporphyrinogen oxidase
MNVLVTAASTHGATAQIAQAIADVLDQHDIEATVIPPETVDDVVTYDAVVIGSASYLGHWLEPAKEFVRRSAASLSTRPVWLFSSGPVGDPSRKLAQKMTADPVDLPEILQATHAREHRLFAGKLLKKDLTRPQRASLVVFRGLEGDFRDWDAVRDWGSQIARALLADA